MTVVAVKISRSLLNELDNLVRIRYRSRSEAIRIAIRELVRQELSKTTDVVVEPIFKKILEEAR